MKFKSAAVALVGCTSTSHAFVQRGPSSSVFGVESSARSQLNMVLEMPKKQISKLEQLKVASDHLTHPLLEVSFVVRVRIRRRRCWRILNHNLWVVRGAISLRCDEVILSPSDRYMSTARKALSFASWTTRVNSDR